jgi:general secretion pathway protein K
MSVARGERGAALVVTLIFVTAMAAGAVAFMAGRRTDALTLRGQLQAVEAQAMLDAALQQTIALLANRQPRQTVPPQLGWRFGEVEVLVRFERETGKIDLNAADDRMLRALPLALGVDETRAAALADAVQDWRDDNQLRLELGAEDRDYRGRSSAATGAADRPFANPAELRYLPGVDPVTWAMLQPYLTVYSGATAPEPQHAAGPVRQAIEIARGLPEDEPAGGRDPAQGNADEPADEAGAEDRFGTEDAAGGEADGSSSLSRRDPRSRRDRGLGGTSRGADETVGAEGSGATGGGANEDGVQTVLLDVRFPNGYEAAAKAVISLAGDGAQGPPFIVLDWAPMLRARGDGS